VARIAPEHAVTANTDARLLLTVREAAELLGVGRSKIYELLAGGILESVKIGRARRVPREAVELYVADLRLAQRAPECG
jgi:excisionase family DNA binding protein